jgi:Arc/MetJ-type ribon-helix-helix transcriptional regulator
MPYQLSPELNDRIQSFVFAGYRDEDDAVREELNALEAREQEKLRRWNEGNRIAMEQCRQGLSKPLDVAALLERVEQRITMKSEGA